MRVAWRKALLEFAQDKKECGAGNAAAFIADNDEARLTGSLVIRLTLKHSPAAADGGGPCLGGCSRTPLPSALSEGNQSPADLHRPLA